MTNPNDYNTTTTLYSGWEWALPINFQKSPDAIVVLS